MEGKDHVTTLMIVANEAHRTGAPLVSVETARACSGIGRVVSVVKRGSELIPEFAHASHRVVRRPGGAREDWIPRLRTRGLPTGTRRLELATARSVVEDVRPDLVYAHTVETAEYVRVGLERGLKTVLHLHEPLDQMQSLVEPTGVGPDLVPSAVVGCSTSTSRDAATYFGLPEAEITTILEPVDVAGARRRAHAGVLDVPDRPFVLTVGSMTEVKGVDLWLDTVATVVRRLKVPPLFVWIGRGPKRRWVETQVRRRGLSKHAVVLGPRPNPMPYMAAASVLLLTSRFEGLPLVLLEALSVGTACAGFGVNGVPDAIEEDGVVVPPLDVHALAEAAVSLLEDEGRRREIRSRAPRRMIAVFDRHRFHDQTRGLVNGLLEEP